MSLITDLPVDEHTSSACGVLGRALYVACSFEDDCRTLALVLKLREPRIDGQADDEAFEALSKAVLGRLFDLNKLIARRAKLPEDHVASLHAARDSRNYIAHEAAGDLGRAARTPGGIGEWQRILSSKIEDVAYGKLIVAVLFSRNSAEPTPTQDAVDAYPSRVQSWVFGRET